MKILYESLREYWLYIEQHWSYTCWYLFIWDNHVIHIEWILYSLSYTIFVRMNQAINISVSVFFFNIWTSKEIHLAVVLYLNVSYAFLNLNYNIFFVRHLLIIVKHYCCKNVKQQFTTKNFSHDIDVKLNKNYHKLLNIWSNSVSK